MDQGNSYAQLGYESKSENSFGEIKNETNQQKTELSRQVRKRRFELPRQLRRYHLKVVRLPISPPP